MSIYGKSFYALITCMLCASSVVAQQLDEKNRVTLPEVVVQPDAEPTESSGPFDLPLTYPSMSDIKLKGYASALRTSVSIFDDPREITVVDQLELQKRQPRNMVEAIEREVGVLMQQTGAGQVSPFIRGLTGPQTVMMIDGVRLNNSTFRYGPNQYFATIDPGMIERIEIVRGPQSVMWGSDAIGGVINVVTKSADSKFCNYTNGQFTERFVSADTGSYSRLSVEGTRNRWGLYGGASSYEVQNVDRGGRLGTQPVTNFSQFGGDLKLDYRLDTNQKLTVVLQHNQENNVKRADKWPGELRRFDPQMRDLGYIRWQGAELDGGLFDSFMFTTSYQRMEERSTKRKPPTSATEEVGDFDVGTTGINLVFGKEIGRFGKLTYGVDWYHDEVDATKSVYEVATDRFVRSEVPQFPNDSYYESLGVFLQWQTDITDRLSAVTGVRYSNIDAGATVANFDVNDPNFPNVDPIETKINPSFQDWTASVGLTYKLTPYANLVGSISEGFRAPSLDELTSVSDNVYADGVDLPSTGLRPETSINYEVGVKFNFPRLRGQVYHFWTDLDGLMKRVIVQQKTGIDYYRRQNIGSATIHGVELAGEYLLTTRWCVYGNFSTIYGQDLSDDEPLRRIPPRQGVFGLRWRNPEAKYWFEFYAWAVGKQDRLSPGDIRDQRIPDGGTPGYVTLNVRGGMPIGDHQRLTLGIDNITDRYYRVHGSGVDGPGISGILGYELVW